jgi:dCMP deaminase
MVSRPYKRPDWDTYFMDIARVVKRRGNCRRRQVAAVIAKEHRIISTGYNGTPSGIRNCNEGGCPRCAGNAPSGEQLGDCICAHAEENAIVQAAYHGVALKDAVLYSTESPCLLCAKLIITAGIKEVVYAKAYRRSRQVAALFREAGVLCRRFRRRAPTA